MTMDPVLEQAYSDAVTIMAAISPLALMAEQALSLCRHGVELSGTADEVGKKIARDTRDQSAKVLQNTRIALDKLMQDMGDYFNNHDAVGATMETLTSPMYELFLRRAKGESLDE